MIDGERYHPEGMGEDFVVPQEARPAMNMAGKSGREVFGVELEGKSKRSPEELRALKDRIGLIARVFSRNYDMKVLPSPTGGWSCGINAKSAQQVDRYVRGEVPSLDNLPAESFRPTDLFYDVNDLERWSEDEVLGVLRHEVGHANNTDYKLFFQGQRLAKDEGYLPTSWVNIANALEDPWVNNREIAGSQVVREKMSRLYEARTPEIVAKIGTQPVTRQLGLNIIYYWLHGENIPTLKNKKVLETFEKIKPFVDRYFTGPNAQDNFDNLKDNIWPLHRELEKKATEDESMKELARKLAGSKLGQPKEGDNGQESPSGSTGNQGREGQSGQPRSGSGQESGGIMQQLKKMMGGGHDRPEQSEEQREDNEQIEQEARQKASAELKRKLKKEIDRQAAEQERQEEQLRKDGQESGALPDDVDLDKLPDDVKEELAKLVKELDPETRKKLDKLAKQHLDHKQAKAIERDSPRHLQTKQDKRTGEHQVGFPPAPADREIEKMQKEIEKHEAEQAAEQEANQADEHEAKQMTEAEQAEQRRQEAEQREMLKNGFDESERDLYQRFRELESSMQERITSFIRILDRYLPKKETYAYGGEYYTGTKLNPRVVPKRAPIKDYRIYQRREIIPSDEPRMFVELLIDNSGSMSGEKMDESLKTAIFWGRVLKRYNVPFAIKFFGDQVVDVMTFDDDYDDPKKKIKVNLVQKADASGASTDMGSPLVRAREEMTKAKRKYTDSFGAVFVISDSGANTGMTGTALAEYITDMQKTQIVMNFILSQSSREIQGAKQLFGDSNVVAPPTFRELPEESFNVLRVTLERILKVYRPTS